jgi:predicted nucleic acid-binding protein
MRLLLDANILLSVLLNEQGRAMPVARMLSMQEHKKWTFCITTISITICFYLLGKRVGAAESKKRLSNFVARYSVIPCDAEETSQPFADKRIYDLKDGLQYHPALKAKCAAIITFDASDFYFSEIPVYSPTDFLHLQ